MALQYAIRIASGADSHKLVDPSMSVNRSVTVPDGAPIPTEAACHRAPSWCPGQGTEPRPMGSGPGADPSYRRPGHPTRYHAVTRASRHRDTHANMPACVTRWRSTLHGQPSAIAQRREY